MNQGKVTVVQSPLKHSHSNNRLPGSHWSAREVRQLRRHMLLTQAEFAKELNIRQQTVSEWETKRHHPRGPSVKLLALVAEKVGFKREALSREQL